MSLYDRIADLPLRIEGWDLDVRERETSSGFERATTTVTLRGDGERGRGEDVTYENDAHHALLEAGLDAVGVDLSGEYTHREFSAAFEDRDLFPGSEPEHAHDRYYRRWAFESAALDLALKQADTNLAAALDRGYDPVRFVVSTRLGDPPSADRVERWLDVDPDLEFKLDPTTDWTPDLIEALASTDAVRIVDLKGLYEGTEVDQAADPGLYRRVLRGFPDAVVEDPAITGETRDLVAANADRVSWDYPITDVESLRDRPFDPAWINVKPSRFGRVAALLDTVEYCEDNGVGMYGGGQFELGVGRRHLHAFASVFYPSAPNDVAPGGYNAPEPAEGLARSPLAPPEAPRGLEW